MSKQKIAFIINPISGSNGKKDIPLLLATYLDRTRFEPSIFYTDKAGHATEIAQELVAEDCPYVVAVGGDGTINEIGRSLVHTNSALGIIPSGSGNGLARHLKIPMNTKKAIDYLNRSQVIDIDYGRADGKVFFCTCGVGFDAHISQQFALAGKRGVKTYVEKVITEYITYKPQKYCLKNEEVNHEQNAFLITFANASQYGNNAYIAPHADLQDGVLDISILSDFPLIFAPELAIRLFSKKIDKSHYMTTIQTDKITLLREKADAFHFDGEASEAGTTIDVEIVPKGLKVLALM